MKKVLVTLGIILAANVLHAQETFSLTLEVKNMLNRKGEMVISVFDSEQNYLKSAVKAAKFDLTTHEGNTFVIDDLPNGNYAISIIHDENKNGDLDFGNMGPEEGYGFSNNPPAMFGPAKYEQAVFEFSENKNMTINLL